jgi:hypothetical protein
MRDEEYFSFLAAPRDAGRLVLTDMLSRMDSPIQLSSAIDSAMDDISNYRNNHENLWNQNSKMCKLHFRNLSLNANNRMLCRAKVELKYAI